MTLATFLSAHKKVTRSLRNLIQDYQNQLQADQFEKFLGSLNDALLQARTEILRAPAGPERARLLHKMIDQEIRQSTKVSTTCQKGCAACCHMEVEITSDEATILVELIDNGFAIDTERLALQAARPAQSTGWQERMKSTTNRCVFLNSENSCGIYDSRPLMCRRHAVTSPAVNCESFGSEISTLYFPRVDLLISAANEDNQLKVGPMAKMIVARN